MTFRVLVLFCSVLVPAGATGFEMPRIQDARLSLTLVAEQPDIVTPIGMVIDRQDRLLVIESHTHHPPADYDGPEFDHIKVFEDRNRDGVPEFVGVFAEGFDAAMNLAVAPDGTIYVCCAREVYALPDADGDGVCDQKRLVLRLETDQGYAHNCLMGIAFDNDGRMYVSRGNVGSMAHTLRGSDGSTVSGYGDGGSICRCDADGGNVELVATGFWNPFEIDVDRSGRLLCVDNDPDGRGPNRLVHVVARGDYGYRSLYGGSGNHPFQGWDGDLPGVLPIASGTGEAPSGLLDCSRCNLPTEYADDVLVTVWNENTIERHTMRQSGLSIVADRQTLLTGDKDFRPVAIDADSRGNIYFTDWVLVAYPNHGRGRVWRIDVPPELAQLPRRRRFDPYEPDPYRSAASELAQHPESLRTGLQSKDPFRRHLATVTLAGKREDPIWRNFADDRDPAVRLGALLSATTSGAAPESSTADKWLSDHDAEVRRAALIWVGRSRQPELRELLDQALHSGAVSGRVFETYLAALECVDPDFVAAYDARTFSHSKKIPRRVDDAMLRRLALDARHSSDVRRLAVARLSDTADSRNRGFLGGLLRNGPEPLRLAAIRRLADSGDLATANALLGMAINDQLSLRLRAEAVAALAHTPDFAANRLLPLLDSDSPDLAIEAVRAMRSMQLNATTRAALLDRWSQLTGDDARRNLAEQLELCLGRAPRVDRPDTVDQWKARLASGGDARRGRRVFHSPHVTCTKCHTMGRSGGTLGPDLSGVARSVSREQIIHSIVRPSDQFAPQYQAWQIISADGRVHTGLQLDHKAGGSMVLFTTEGSNVYFEAEDVETYFASPNSVMPSGLEANLGVEEFRDLVAFLCDPADH